MRIILFPSPRWLPGSKQFQLPKNPHDPYPQLYVILDTAEFLGAVAGVVGVLGGLQGGVVLQDAKRILEVMLSQSHGVRYLAAHPGPAMSLARILIQVCVCVCVGVWVCVCVCVCEGGL